MSLFFPFSKQKATNGPVPDHICPISRKPWQCFSFLFMTCLSWNYGWIMCNSVAKNKKISLKNTPKQPHHSFLWHTCVHFFCCLGICSFVYEMKITRIKGHEGLKIIIPKIKHLCMCLPWQSCCTHSFEKQHCHLQAMAFFFCVLTDNRCGTREALLLWLLVHLHG